MKFNFYSDPAHGWAKVPLSLLKELKIDQKISSYSYVKKGNAYLEEDGDLGVFINAMKKAGKTVSFKESHTNKSSRIRNYPRYGYDNVKDIIGVTYSVAIGTKIIEKIVSCDTEDNTLKGKLEKREEIHSVDYAINKGKLMIHIKTTSLKKHEPSTNRHYWQEIANIINHHIKEE